MLEIGVFLTIFIPGLAAAGLHLRIFRMRRAAGPLICRALFYAFCIGILLSAAKLARGNGEIRLADSFSAVVSFVRYGALGAALALILPLLARAFYLVLLRAARKARRKDCAMLRSLLGGLLDVDAPAPSAPPAPPAPPAPKPQAPPKAAAPISKPAGDAVRVQKLEASLAAQEAEMAANVDKVVPRRKIHEGPQRILYNVSIREEKRAPKTIKQRAAWIGVYGFMCLLAVLIVCAVYAS